MAKLHSKVTINEFQSQRVNMADTAHSTLTKIKIRTHASSTHSSQVVSNLASQMLLNFCDLKGSGVSQVALLLLNY